MAEEVVFYVSDPELKCVFEQDGTLYIQARACHIRLDRDLRDEFVAWVRAWGRYYPGKENHPTSPEKESHGNEPVALRRSESQ